MHLRENIPIGKRQTRPAEDHAEECDVLNYSCAPEYLRILRDW